MTKMINSSCKHLNRTGVKIADRTHAHQGSICYQTKYTCKDCGHIWLVKDVYTYAPNLKISGK